MPGPTSTDTVRRGLLAGTLIATPLLLLAGSALQVDTGEESGAASLAAVAADRGQFYAGGLLLALGLAALSVCALGLMQLTRGRGGALGTVGGCLVVVAGAAAGAGIFMYTAVLHTASGEGLDREAMGAFDEAASDSMAVGLPFMVGFVGIALGLVLLAAALWRAGTAPRWACALLALAAVGTWFADSWATGLLTTSAFFVLWAFAAELLRNRTIALPDVPAQAAAPAPPVHRQPA